MIIAGRWVERRRQSALPKRVGTQPDCWNMWKLVWIHGCPTFLIARNHWIMLKMFLVKDWSWLMTLRYFEDVGVVSSKVFQRVSIHFSWHVAAMWIGLMTSTAWWSLVCFPKLDDGNTGNLSEVNPIKHPELGWLIIDFTTTWARKRDVPVIRSN